MYKGFFEKIKLLKILFRNSGTIVYFNLANPLTDLSSQTISLKAYTSIQTTDLNTQNKRIQLYLRNSTIGWGIWTLGFEGNRAVDSPGCSRRA